MQPSSYHIFKAKMTFPCPLAHIHAHESAAVICDILQALPVGMEAFPPGGVLVLCKKGTALLWGHPAASHRPDKFVLPPGVSPVLSAVLRSSSLMSAFSVMGVLGTLTLDFTFYKVHVGECPQQQMSGEPPAVGAWAAALECGRGLAGGVCSRCPAQVRRTHLTPQAAFH